jgi:predicted dehydrogenase
VLGGFSSVVGEFDDLQSVYKTQTRTTTLLDASYQPSKPNVAVQGVLKSGATASINLRTNASPVDDIGFRWIISGTLGEIEVLTKPGFIQTGLSGATIKLRKRGEETAKVIEWENVDPASVSSIQGMGQSIGRAYAAFAEGRTADYATFETALAVHRVMEKATKNALWAGK